MEKFDNVDRAISSASVYGAVTSLSPVKKGCKTNYFEGTVSDENSNFDTKQQKRMDDFKTKKQPKNCEVKPSRRGDNIEILLKANISISEMSKKILKYLTWTLKITEIKLDDLQSLQKSLWP